MERQAKSTNAFGTVLHQGSAIADALKIGYAPLYKRNEFTHALGKEELSGIVIEETGAGKDSVVPDLVVSAIQSLKKYAKFDGAPTDSKTETVSAPVLARAPELKPEIQVRARGLGMNLSYTVNLNLPATSDIAVFNAIFKSLKENLLVDLNEA